MLLLGLQLGLLVLIEEAVGVEDLGELKPVVQFLQRVVLIDDAVQLERQQLRQRLKSHGQEGFVGVQMPEPKSIMA